MILSFKNQVRFALLDILGRLTMCQALCCVHPYSYDYSHFSDEKICIPRIVFQLLCPFPTPQFFAHVCRLWMGLPFTCFDRPYKMAAMVDSFYQEVMITSWESHVIFTKIQETSREFHNHPMKWTKGREAKSLELLGVPLKRPLPEPLN